MRWMRGGKHLGLLILCVNLLLVGCVGAAFLRYHATAEEKLLEQNLTDIRNINQSSAKISGAFFQNQQQRLADVVKYSTTRALSRTEVLSYLCDANSDAGSTYELIQPDCTGFAAVRTEQGFVPVDYTNTDYQELKQIFTGSTAHTQEGILCTPEFTDSYTARKSFALYTPLSCSAGAGSTEQVVLMAVLESSSFAGLIDIDGSYTELASVLINQAGDYVFGSPAFKSNNLFAYLYGFSGLTLDQKDAMIQDFSRQQQGTLYGRDSKGRDCVFVYTDVPDTQWHCVSCVPISSFHNTKLDLHFTVLIAVLLLCLMCFNILWLNRINRQLKGSIQREHIASAAKTDFLSRMSHDIRTPLNVIIGTTRLARQEELPASTRRYLDNIDQSGKFLLSLVNDILDLNKVESGNMELHPQPCAMRELAASMRGIILPLCQEKGLDFSLSGFDTEEAYLLDPVRMKQILFNLLSNSVKFTPQGGHIGLSCTSAPCPDGKTELCFRAFDDGQGMSEAFQKHMFEAFSQEEAGHSSTAQGTGLGLAIVKNLVTLMGGALRVESALGQGTTFFITLIAPRGEAPVGTEPEAPTVSLSGKRVLLFEDNALNAEIATALLRERGMLVEHAADGQEGLTRFTQSPLYYYDAILMDMRMPVMDGLEATRKLRRLERADAPQIPVIAMTANAYDNDVEACFAAGMNAHLAKPIEPELLFACLSRQLSARDKPRHN